MSFLQHLNTPAPASLLVIAAEPIAVFRGTVLANSGLTPSLWQGVWCYRKTGAASEGQSCKDLSEKFAFILFF